MQTGISTGCLYPMLTEESIHTLTSLGFRLFEIFFNSFSELETDFLDRLHCFLEQQGAAVASVHPFTSSFESFLLFSNYERRFLDGVTFYEMFFRTAQRLGADKVILHGLNTSYRSTISDREYFRRFAVLQERAHCYGVTLLQENVSNFRSRDPDFLRAMIQEIPEHAAFVLDIKQALRSGTDPLTIAQIMGSRLRHVHISGSTSDQCCVLPDRSDYDCRPLLQYLKETHYDDPVILEVYRFSFEQPEELIQSRHFLENISHRY